MGAWALSRTSACWRLDRMRTAQRHPCEFFLPNRFCCRRRPSRRRPSGRYCRRCIPAPARRRTPARRSCRRRRGRCSTTSCRRAARAKRARLPVGARLAASLQDTRKVGSTHGADAVRKGAGKDIADTPCPSSARSSAKTLPGFFGWTMQSWICAQRAVREAAAGSTKHVLQRCSLSSFGGVRTFQPHGRSATQNGDTDRQGGAGP